MSEEPPRSPYPSKSALTMLSRAGKSTTNQYLALMKIENSDGLSSSPVKKKSDTETLP